MKEILNKIFHKIINYVYPQKCILCDQIFDIVPKIEICDNCYMGINFYKSEMPVKGFYPSLYVDGVFCVCSFEGDIRRGVLNYKYFGKETYYRAFSKLISDCISHFISKNNFDGIIAIPIHKKRFRERGYNQSYLIAEEISKIHGIKNISDCVIRKKHTKVQSLLNKEERSININDAFDIRLTKFIRHNSKKTIKKVLVIDDILTTGNTVDECAKVLKQNGIDEVYIAVIASGR